MLTRLQALTKENPILDTSGIPRGTNTVSEGVAPDDWVEWADFTYENLTAIFSTRLGRRGSGVLYTPDIPDGGPQSYDTGTGYFPPSTEYATDRAESYLPADSTGMVDENVSGDHSGGDDGSERNESEGRDDGNDGNDDDDDSESILLHDMSQLDASLGGHTDATSTHPQMPVYVQATHEKSHAGPSRWSEAHVDNQVPGGPSIVASSRSDAGTAAARAQSTVSDDRRRIPVTIQKHFMGRGLYYVDTRNRKQDTSASKWKKVKGGYELHTKKNIYFTEHF
ncbi:hypothetical protein SPBR_09204 [Sporothrix brasiliensis 5110]|uniref:Uncharacterized protein n=1 Tax=Sporothrix brasiliensis 5110 TaxID=1398154 RepID=A0A0C2F4K7_9PEZI|nr:uncharacterized protein SPBR_09204 [Sporothrix brasiliensis 5110]KIH93839.1 hypothetical protein SPBR_09204 [Sporothrix brasiliensis 5110]